jgi:hypothetical protein
MVKTQETSIDERLEELGLELYLVRGLNNKGKKKNKSITAEIKRIMNERNEKEYDGREVHLEIKDISKPRTVNSEVAGKYVPFDRLLTMVEVDKEKFQIYVKEHHPNLKESDYLISPGTRSDLQTPKIKIPIGRVKDLFQDLYQDLAKLITGE